MKFCCNSFLCLTSILTMLFSSGCIRDYVTIERTVNAVWSADNTEILKIVSTYETYKPGENYYYARASKDWKYRFEICSPDLSDCKVVGSAHDGKQDGIMQYVPVYWLRSVQKIAYLKRSNEAVLKDLTGGEKVLEPPSDIINTIFAATKGSHEAIDVAPSPKEDVIAVYLQSAYFTGSNYTDFSYCQCVSFFDSKSGSHISTREVPFNKTDPALNVVYQFHNMRCHFLWSKEGSGVYVVTRSKAYLLKYGSSPGIEQVDLVPERGTKANSGNISNSGLQLRVNIDGNNTLLEIVQLTDWKPFGSLGLIRRDSNIYSFW
jgi:hypothetical protein